MVTRTNADFERIDFVRVRHPLNKDLVGLYVWPSPLNADACFEAAGVRDFADLSSRAEAHWQEFVDALLKKLEARFSKPYVIQAIHRAHDISLWERLKMRVLRLVNKQFVAQRPHSLTLVEQLTLATEDDRYGTFVIRFGSEIELRAGDGHRAIWFDLQEPVLEDLLKIISVSSNLPLTEKSYDMSPLRPDVRDQAAIGKTWSK